jgi:hypothetical protein
MQPFTQGKPVRRLRRLFVNDSYYTRKAIFLARTLLCLLSLISSALYPAILQAQPPEDTASTIQEFVKERNKYIADAGITKANYIVLVEKFAARLPLETLSLPELAVATTEGLLDTDQLRERGATRLSSLPPDALNATVRLRLLGAVTFEHTPDLALQKKLLGELLEHPGLSDLMASENAHYAVDALCSVGRSTALSERKTEILKSLSFLNPAKSPEIAEDLGRLQLLVYMCLPDRKERRSALERLLTYAKQAVAAPGVSPRAKSLIEKRVTTLEDILKSTDDARGTPTDLNRFPQVLWDLLRSAAPEEEPLVARSRLYPEEEVSLPLRNDVLYPRQDTRVITRDSLILPFGAFGVRAFEGIDIQDSYFGLKASAMGLDLRGMRGFFHDLSIKFGPYDLRAKNIDFNEKQGEIVEPGLFALYHGKTLVSVQSDRVSLTPKGEGNDLNVENVKVTALRLRLLTIPKFHTYIAPPEPKPDVPEGPKEPRGQSPITQLIVLPTIGYESGGVTFGYRNAYKFAKRFTIPFSIRTYTGDKTTWEIGLNYNLLQTTDRLDRFTEADYLQEEYLGSYYYDIRNDGPLGENLRMFRPALFTGVYAGHNLHYVDERTDLKQTNNIPYAVRIEGTKGFGNVLGTRLQISRERVDDHGYGSDSRWVALGMAGPPPIRLFRGTHLFLRAEGVSRNGGSGSYSWLRGLGGITTRLTPGFRLSFSYLNSAEKGKPRFPYDEVPADEGYTARGDFILGSFHLNIMNQYSKRIHRWTRWQVYLSEYVGALEPYLSFDQRLTRVSVGLSYPISDFLDRLLRRKYSSVSNLPEGVNVSAEPSTPNSEP